MKDWSPDELKKLKELREIYHRDLFDDYLPFWEEFGIDHEKGGFMCALEHDGTRINNNKYLWYQGRGLWVYSFLAQHFPDHRKRSLEIAHKAAAFLRKFGRDENNDWYLSVDREGNPTDRIDELGYAGIFVSEGFQAYARVTGDESALDFANDCLYRSLHHFHNPNRKVEDDAIGYIPRNYTGMRILGSEMVLINTIPQMLEQREDPKLRVLLLEAIDNVLQKFWNPEHQLTNEVLDKDLNRPHDENEDFFYLGHATETYWMIMSAALFLRDQAMFDTATERFKSHLERAWDEEAGGFSDGIKLGQGLNPIRHLWQQEEVLIGCLMLLEHTDLKWPLDWFTRTQDYITDKFHLAKHGYPVWAYGSFRDGDFRKREMGRKENYHLPRRLMLNLLAFDRILEN